VIGHQDHRTLLSGLLQLNQKEEKGRSFTENILEPRLDDDFTPILKQTLI